MSNIAWYSRYDKSQEVIGLKRIPSFYHPQTKLREGDVFTRVCHSVHRGKGCRPPDLTPPIWSHTHPGHTPLDTPLGHPPPIHTPPDTPLLRSTSDGTHPSGMLSCRLFFCCSCCLLGRQISCTFVFNFTAHRYNTK